MKLPESVISDADGTLVNTLRLIRYGQFETCRSYLTEIGVTEADIPDLETYETVLHEVIGGSASDTLEKTMKILFRERSDILDSVNYTNLHARLNPIQDAIAPEFVKAYEGLSDFLKSLGSAGINLAIFTSGTPHHVVRNLGISIPEIGLVDLYKRTNMDDVQKLRIFEKTLAEYFGIPIFTVVTCDDVAVHKPDPASIFLAINRLQSSPERSLVLGDHEVDMKSAINANVAERVGIVHGFDDERTLLAAGATSIVHSLIELTDRLNERADS